MIGMFVFLSFCNLKTLLSSQGGEEGIIAGRGYILRSVIENHSLGLLLCDFMILNINNVVIEHPKLQTESKNR